jgi:DNA modification methylase
VKIEHIHTSKLTAYANNSRTHSAEQVHQVAASIKEFGFTNPILIDDKNEIIAGHGRHLAAIELGIDQVPCIRLGHLTEAQKRAYVIADNKIAENSGWDEDKLALEFEALLDMDFNAALTGFSDDEVGKLLQFVPDTIGETDPDEVPEIQEAVVTQVGEVWCCGDHRVLCGDSTSAANLEKLMDGGTADMVFTDPPYLMNFVGSPPRETGAARPRNSKHEKIINDKMPKAEGDAFLKDVCAIVKQFCSGPWYICFYRLGIDRILQAINANGMKWRGMIVWKKNNINLSNSDYKSLYEPIITGYADDYDPIFYGWNLEHNWFGEKNERDVWEIELPSIWEIAKTKVNDLHPTMKPVDLVVRAIKNSSRRGRSVLDIFLGSGTTMIAAEICGRICYGTELDPRYVDVIVRRWQDFTGQQATLQGDGRTFSEVAEARC